jgi:hypothetical protein
VQKKCHLLFEWPLILFLKFWNETCLLTLSLFWILAKIWATPLDFQPMLSLVTECVRLNIYWVPVHPFRECLLLEKVKYNFLKFLFVDWPSYFERKYKVCFLKAHFRCVYLHSSKRGEILWCNVFLSFSLSFFLSVFQSYCLSVFSILSFCLSVFLSFCL